MVIFTLFLLITMLIVAGMAVDLMRFETTRTRLQSTLDRAVLAAADLDQAMDAEDVVNSYFTAAGLEAYLGDIIVDEAINSREVTADAVAQVDSYFLNMVGIEELDAPAISTAIENVSDIEIILVLDVSGSMGEASGGSTKIANLRIAARDFVREVLDGDVENRISIGIVPFNAQVNIGPQLRARYNIANLHGVSGSDCVDLPGAVYGVGAISTTLSMPQAGYFDANSGSSTSGNNYQTPQAMNPSNLVCKTVPENLVLLPTRSISALETRIAGLTANGQTSITMGMRWGLNLIDPGTRPVFANLVGAGLMQGQMAERPFNYDRANTLKIIVLMTDGEHVGSVILNPGYRTELSPIYRAPDGNYSIFHDRSGTTADFWTPHRDPDGNNSNGIQGEWRTTAWNGGGAPSQLGWHQVWSQVRMTWVAWQLYARALGTSNSTRSTIYNNMMATFRSSTNVANMNTTLQQSCTFARNNGIVVFGIAFEAPTNGQTQIFNCASTPSHYFDAEGLEIQTAFRAIANQINQLRLTQ